MKVNIELNLSEFLAGSRSGTLRALGEALKNVDEEELLVADKAIDEAPVESKPNPPAPKEAERVEAKTTTHSLDDLVKAFKDANTKENRPALKAILTQVGVKRVPDIPEDKYDEVMKAVKKLQKEK